MALWVVLEVLGGRIVLAQNAAVALHATPYEVKMWQQRMQQGPYRDDWQRILSRAQNFLRQPQAELWPGNLTDQPWDGDKVQVRQQAVNVHPHRKQGDALRDAGFVYLLTGEIPYRDAVRQALLAQAGMPGADFHNVSRWNSQKAGLNNDNHNIVNWIRKLAYGYSYIRASVSPADKEVIDRWFLHAALFWDNCNHLYIAARFPRHYQDDYRLLQGSEKLEEPLGKTHWGGATVYKFHRAWLNKPAASNALVAAVGVLLGEATLKEHAKRFVKEWLMVCVTPDGTVCDQYRWNEHENPQTAFAYAGTAIGSIVTAADHLARAGDRELYEYTTSAGFYGWEGGPKGLRLVIQRLAELTLGDLGMAGGVKAFASKDESLTQLKLIGPRSNMVYDLGLLPANLYYDNALVKKAYSRPLSSRPHSGGYDAFGGDWGTYPGVRFMFAELEGKVWPYPQLR